jgi:hypothetical protein
LIELPAAADNSEMGQPFQFSMRRMFVSVAIICLAAWLFGLVLLQDKYPWVRETNTYFIVAAGMLFGAAIGNLWRRPIKGAFIGFCLVIVGFFVMLMIAGYVMSHAGPGN